MRFGSVCSGIEAASVAWKPLGWQAAFVSEIEPFPRAVLAHHYPETPLHGDFTTIKAGQYEPIDLLVGGTPCQSFSIAGLRGGLDDDRGNLALEYLRLADRLRPRWLVWENVPGVLSSNGGRDFGAILGGMVELGYGVAYRVLDAQHFGVAQRRRRVFVVGYLGDWRRAAAVLFERESLSGHPAPRREAGKGFAGGVGERPEIGCPAVSPALKARDYKGPSSDGDGDGAPLIAHTLRAQAQASHRSDTETYVAMIAPTLCAGGNKTGGDRPYGTDVDTCDSLVVFDTTQITSAANYSSPKPGDPCHPLAAGAHAPAVAFSIMPMNSGKDFKGRETDIAQPVMAAGPAGGNQGGDYVVQSALMSACEIAETLSVGANQPTGFPGDFCGHGSAVRRLTPEECEKLQGFLPGYTAIPYRGKPAADGPRYKALGNSMAVPVMAWIGRRIAAVEALNIREEAA